MKDLPPPSQPPRRTFLRGILVAAAALPAALGAWFVVHPRRSRHGRTYRLGSTNELFVAGPAVAVRTGGTAVAVVRAGDGVVAMDLVCTHAGCPLTLQGTAIRCRCHGGAFDLEGRPVAGPPTSPLLRLPVVERDGVWYVRRADV